MESFDSNRHHDTRFPRGGFLQCDPNGFGFSIFSAVDLAYDLLEVKPNGFGLEDWRKKKSRDEIFVVDRHLVNMSLVTPKAVLMLWEMERIMFFGWG